LKSTPHAAVPGINIRISLDVSNDHFELQNKTVHEFPNEYKLNNQLNMTSTSSDFLYKISSFVQ
jgi:hypothetical protein